MLSMMTRLKHRVLRTKITPLLLASSARSKYEHNLEHAWKAEVATEMSNKENSIQRNNRANKARNEGDNNYLHQEKLTG